MIDFDKVELLGVFYEILPLTDEAIGLYYYQAVRSDGIKITLSFNIYDQTVGLIVRDNSIVPIAIHLSDCSEIKVLDSQKRQLEFRTKDRIRCFVDLIGENIVSLKRET